MKNPGTIFEVQVPEILGKLIIFADFPSKSMEIMLVFRIVPYVRSVSREGSLGDRGCSRLGLVAARCMVVRPHVGCAVQSGGLTFRMKSSSSGGTSATRR